MEIPWSKQNKLKDKEIPTHADIYLTAVSITNEMVRALYLLLYMTGGRISEVLNIKLKDIQNIYKGDRRILLINMVNRKHKSRKRKDIPIPFDKEKELLRLFIDYANTLEPDDLLFPISRSQAYKLIYTATGLNPHFLRHIRLTHLVQMNDMNEFLLAKYAGWTDTRPAKHYMELRWTDILQKL